MKDNGTIYSTRQQILSFLTETTSEFDYTTTFKRANRSDDGRWTVWNRLEGNFPGGVVDLKYVFTLDGYPRRVTDQPPRHHNLSSPAGGVGRVPKAFRARPA